MDTAALLQRRGNMNLTMLDIQEERAAYEAPKVRQAQMVMFYPSGQKDSNAYLAWVTRAHEGSKTIAQLYVPLGSPKVAESVPHVSDPVLKLGGSHIENGAWDYTGVDDHVQKQIDDLRKEVITLRRQIRSKDK